MSKINEQHKNHLNQLDKILSRIYNEGVNQATYLDIFKNKPDTELSKMVAIFFINQNDPELEALKYLISEGLVLNNNNNYSLTFKGILKIHTNTFVEEYENKLKMQGANYLFWILAPTFSGLAILLGLVNLFNSIFKWW